MPLCPLSLESGSLACQKYKKEIGGDPMPFSILRNDITKMPVDAIVNAANESLLGGGGVDDCIHRAAGPELLAECRQLGGCRTGDAKITGAYRLPCKYVIHTVGPVWSDGRHGEQELLASCYRTSLALAKEHDCQTVAFPLIASGIFGYPKDQALRVAVDTIGEFLMENDMTVYLVIFDRASYQISGRLFADIAEYIDDHYVDAHIDSQRERMRRTLHAARKARAVCNETAEYMAAPAAGGLDDLLTHLDAGFSETLLQLIDRSGRKDSEVYKKANLDRKLFSKIRSNPGLPAVQIHGPRLRHCTGAGPGRNPGPHRPGGLCAQPQQQIRCHHRIFHPSEKV